MNKCKLCPSHAINPGQVGRDETSDLDLCDVCYWRTRAEATIPRHTVAEALAALRTEVLLLMTAPPKTSWQQDHDTGVMDALICLDATIAKLGLDAQEEGK